MSKRSRTDPVNARIAFIDEKVPFGTNVVDRMADIQDAVTQCAHAISNIVREDNQTYDTDLLIHAIDLLQRVKYTACMSLILPNYQEQDESSKKNKDML